MARCPREGTRVRFTDNPVARMFYMTGLYRAAPKPGEGGTVTSLPLPGGRATCLPGPGGGMWYVRWDGGGTFGVLRAHLERERAARRRR